MSKWEGIILQNYAESLSRLIQAETVSVRHQTDLSKFYRFHDILREMFPNLFQVCHFEDFHGSFLLHWKGSSNKSPILLMNHHDVVEANGNWRYPPFSGIIADGKIWGRGTLDTKSGLWGMLQAAEELVVSGYVPTRDTYFLSSCTEETDGSGADAISLELARRGIRFSMVLDEGGMILSESIAGAKGTYAMIGLGEKGQTNLKFVARSSGGHASTPDKNTPLVRLGRFMNAVERSHIFKADIHPAVCQMFRKLSITMAQPLKFLLNHPVFFKPLLCKALPSISAAAGAMVKTTIAFTMAQGSEGCNVLPQEAWLIGNMRFSHHQGRTASIEAVRQLACKYDIETIILDAGMDTTVTDYHSEAYQKVSSIVETVFPDVIPTPYLMTGASDSRFLSRICDNCIRFAPFTITHEQLNSVHGLDENLDISTLSSAVAFYKQIILDA